MQATRLSTYNTETVNIQKKVDLVKGAPVLASVANGHAQVAHSVKDLSKPRTNNFDFAGLAG